MQALNEYVAQKNRWNSLFNSAPLDLNSAQDRKQIAQYIDSDLSPENLSCDGELPASQVRARYKQLNTVAKQLQKLDPTVAQYMYEVG
jgi:hypothetical protein